MFDLFVRLIRVDLYVRFFVRFHVRFLRDFFVRLVLVRLFSDFFVRFHLRLLSDFLCLIFLSDFYMSDFLYPILLSHFLPIYFVRLARVRFFVLFSLLDSLVLFYVPFILSDVFMSDFLFDISGLVRLVLDRFFSDFSIRFHVRFLPDYCPIFYIRVALSDFFVRIFLSDLFMSDFLSYFLCPILLSYFLCPISCSIFCSICCHIFGGDFSSKKIEHVSCIATFVMYCQCVKSFYYYDSIVSRHVWVSSRAIIVLWLLVSYNSSHQWHRT